MRLSRLPDREALILKGVFVFFESLCTLGDPQAHHVWRPLLKNQLRSETVARSLLHTFIMFAEIFRVWNFLVGVESMKNSIWESCVAISGAF